MTSSLTARAWSAAHPAARLSRPDMTPATGRSLGTLATIAQWWAGGSTDSLTAPQHVHAVVVIGDHPGISAAEATSHSPQDTLDVVRSVHAGTAALTHLADAAGVHVHPTDISMAAAPDGLPLPITASHICDGSRRIDLGDAASHDDVLTAFTWGRERVNHLADSGADLVVIGHIGAGAPAPATALITLLTNTDLVDNVGRSDVADDAMWMRKTALIREAIMRTRPHTHDPVGMIAVCGGADMAAITGMLLQGAVRGLPILMDGVTTAAAALIAERMMPGAHVWWAVADEGTEPAALRAYERTHLTPWLSLGIGNGDATGALIAVSLLHAALTVVNAPN